MSELKILILGASGKIGDALMRFLLGETEHHLILLSSRADEMSFMERVIKYKVNALDKKETKKICLDVRPNVIIDAASMSSPEQCETEKQLAWELNAHVVESLARTAKIIDSHLIMFSTDQVFDGESGPYYEVDKPNASSYYGKSKHAGENLCLIGCSTSTVIRIPMYYGNSAFSNPFDDGNRCNNVFDELLIKFDMDENIKLSRNGMTNPVFTDDIARIVEKIIVKKRYGIYNAGGADYISLYDAALKTAEVFGFYENKIEGYNSDNDYVNLPDVNISKSSKREGLITLKAETDLGIKFCTLESGMQAYKFQLGL